MAELKDSGKRREFESSLLEFALRYLDSYQQA